MTDWKAGDLAVCVNDQWFRGGLFPIAGPGREKILRVEAVKMDVGCTCGQCPPSQVFLNFREFGDEWWQGNGFRKIRPDTEAGENSFKEFIYRVARKTVRTPVPADAENRSIITSILRAIGMKGI